MLTVPDNRNEDNPAAADESTTTLAGEGGGSGDQDRRGANLRHWTHWLARGRDGC